MNKISASSLMADMQKMAASASFAPTIPMEGALSGGMEQPQKLDFGQLLKGAVDNVNALQQNSASLKKSFDMGEPGVDLPQVMVAAQKADVAFTATIEVRNKLVDAYKTIMSMSV